MAGEKDAVIELEEEGVVTVDIGGDPDLAAAADELAGGEAVTTKEKPAAVAVQRTSKPSAADEAAAVLTQSLKNSEDARKAAEATALAERQARERTQQTLQQREQETKELRERAEDGEFKSIEAAISAAQRDLDAATVEIERAGDAGDFKALAAAQAKMSIAAAALDRNTDKKASFETRKAAPSTEGRVVEAPAGTPFERYVSGFAPKAQTWLRAHPECVPAEVGGNATKNASMMAGHYEALSKGLQEGTDDYFKVIEERTGYREPTSAAAEVTLAGDRQQQQQQKPVQQRRPAPSAPVSRDTEATGAQSRSVRLTPQQQEVALFSYPSNPGEAETAWKARALGTYARELIKATAEGKIGRISH